MASTFTWLDHSDRDRRRVLEAIDKFAETDTRDELGLGALRDGFADLFFPGTSTIQTRARYFLFIPWAYQRAETRAAADSLAARVRKEELRLRDALMAAGDDDTDGVVGKRTGARTKRLPSSIYWLGLQTWRIRLVSGSQATFHATLTARQKRKQQRVHDDDGDRVDGTGGQPWHPHLPPPPADFPDAASFKLTADEARYLAERIAFAAPESLLCFLVRHGRTLDVDLPWAHPQLAEFPVAIRDALDHARVLAETTQGAALLYNLMLSEELPVGERREELVENYRAGLRRWTEELRQREAAMSRWDRDAFWRLVGAHAHVRQATRQFVDAWLDLAPWRSLPEAEGPAARILIRDRELRLKGKARARLGNPRALELWGGEAGTRRLSYRWEPAVRLLSDIHDALGTVVADA